MCNSYTFSIFIHLGALEILDLEITFTMTQCYTSRINANTKYTEMNLSALISGRITT